MSNWFETIYRIPDKSTKPPGGFICTDLDGTLIHGDSQLSGKDLQTLAELGEKGWIRIIATGRSLESFNRAIPDMTSLPIDYLVFSSGVGIVHSPTRQLIRTINLTPDATTRAIQVMNHEGLDYMVHDEAPDNVRFHWVQGQPGAPMESNPDFFSRIAIYRNLCHELKVRPEQWATPSAQVIGVIPPGNPETVIQRIQDRLPGFYIVRTTSPLDKKSTWVEIYPGIVSKGQACEWLKRQNSPDELHTWAVGNDYNDLDMLDWADSACVMPASPGALRKKYRVIQSQKLQRYGVIHQTIAEQVNCKQKNETSLVKND